MLQARSLCLRARKESDDLTSATVPAGTSLPAAWRNLRSRYAHQAATSLLFDQLNSVPSTHMRCRMTASLRATATLALRSPLRLVSLVPQAFSPDHFGTRVRSTPAASNRYMRSMASPHFEIRPDQSISPEAWRRVVNPIYAPPLRDRLKRVGSSIVALKQSAVIGPTPGTVINLRTCTSRRASL